MRYLIALTLMFLPALAQAQDTPDPKPQQVRAACSDDMLRLCPSVEMGGKMRECMQSHKQDLSSECATAMEQMHSHAH